MIRCNAAFALLFAFTSSSFGEILTFNIDPAKSRLVVAQQFTSGSSIYPAKEISPGSLSTSISGTFQASIDFNQGILSFTGIGQVLPANSNNQTLDFPLGGSVEAAGVVDFGGGNQLVGALRNQSFNIVNPASGPIQMIGGGAYYFNSPLALSGYQEQLYYGITPSKPGKDVVPIWGQGSGTISANVANATLLQTDKWHWQMILPITQGGTTPFRDLFGVTGLQNTLFSTYYVVATAAVPEVSSTLLISALFAIGILGKLVIVMSASGPR